MLKYLSPIKANKDGGYNFTATKTNPITGEDEQAEYCTNNRGEGLFYNTGTERRQAVGTSQIDLNHANRRAIVLYWLLKNDDDFIDWCYTNDVLPSQKAATQFYAECHK